jgi:hypothetical protein
MRTKPSTINRSVRAQENLADASPLGCGAAFMHADRQHRKLLHASGASSTDQALDNPNDKGRPNPLQPHVRDAMLAAVPRLRAFAISLCGIVDRADDLMQENPPARHRQHQLIPAGDEHVRLAIHHPPQPVPVGISQAGGCDL